ncbi:hypothetical protein HU200_038130 [Digitaria exilis]|uniref:DUF4220 domain-containing protein n=1 Tax=Digitaria exilis TaxID=1010633 RepID=A0A835BE70_9POAL|nr:hypothetical protein HU200_038130 [Digitaria exilis]CAB3491818.1 unnamed protein product [Digitaria exilis]
MSQFWRAVQWWEEWQLRFLVLASLFFQYFLFLAALLRKRRIPAWFRALIWLAYQFGDVVAIYALATLFNNHKKDEVAAGIRGHLDTLWAPVLLLHLGGQDGITAYNIEDNENWRRHLLIAASQIAIAIYVFCKSWWFDDTRLLRAAILLFVPGVVKCLEKPWALKNATVTSIIDSSDPQMMLTMEEKDDKPAKTLEDYVQAATGRVKEPQKEETPDEYFVNKMNDEPYHLFVDLSHPYSIRLKNLEIMAAETGRDEVHDRVRLFLSRGFDRLYTKHKASYGGVLRAIVVFLTFVDIGLFQESRRSTYVPADVVVTYILLCCTAALELVSACVVLGSGLPLPDDQIAQYNIFGYLARNKKHWTLRHLAFLLGLKDHLDHLWCTTPPVPSRHITELVHDHVYGGWKDYIDADGVRHVNDDQNKETGSRTGIKAVDYYHRFNDSRGQRTLEWENKILLERSSATSMTTPTPTPQEPQPPPQLHSKPLGHFERSLRRPFDESIIIWHLATEFCYFDHVDTGGDAPQHSRVISNYMAYLLFVRPWMLMPGTRRGLFRAVYLELRKMLGDKKSEWEGGDEGTDKKKKMKVPTRAMDEIARRIIQKVRNPPKRSAARPRPGRVSADELVRHAWDLAHELMEFAKGKAVEIEENKLKEEELERKRMGKPEDVAVTIKKMTEIAISAKKEGDDKMWEVIQSVWVEMLCFSAGRCRGYLHAKILGNGGEYLSYVWLLLSYMGMETMAERMQRTELPLDGDTGALVTTLDLEDDDDNEQAPEDPPRKQASEDPSGTTATSSAAAVVPTGSGAAVVPVVGNDNNV